MPSGGRHGVHAAVEARASIQRLTWQHQAANDAMPAAHDALAIARRPVEVASMRTDNAGVKLRELLKRLKLGTPSARIDTRAPRPARCLPGMRRSSNREPLRTPP
jgi:hypothetical protein